MKAIYHGTVIAESHDTVVVDGNHYFPRDAVEESYLVESATTTICGWKGTAQYFTLQVGEKTNPDAAWYYAEPKQAAEHIRGRVAFWKGVVVTD